MANNIRSYFGDGSDFGVRMVYATEETPLGTAGSVRNAIDELDERFLVISGDVLTDLDLTAIVKAHEEKEALATIALVRVENPLEFGIVITRDDGSIERFLEKPSWGQVFSDTINTGHLRARAGDLRLHRAGPLGRLLLRGVPGDPRRRQAAVRRRSPRATGRTSAPSRATSRPTRTSSTDGCAVEIPGFEMGDGVHVGEGAEIHPDATLVGPAVIGENCRIEAGVRLGPYTVLGTNVRVRAERRPRAGRRARQLLPRGERAAARRHHRPLVRPPPRRARRGGRGARRRVLRR